MADTGKQESSAAAETETPSEFLTNLGTALRGKKDVDVSLADILAEHLLTAVPTVDAVKKAKDAILKLARERAEPSKAGVADG